MSAQAQTRFDIGLLKQSFEGWDLETLLDLYDDDVEQIEMDEVTPPAAPRVRHKDELRQIFENGCKAGVKVTLDNAVVGDDRVACTFTCAFDDGRRVVANSIIDLRGGRIVRQFDVQARDVK
jgi:ketosteroid isomerase-like protein